MKLKVPDVTLNSWIPRMNINNFKSDSGQLLCIGEKKTKMWSGLIYFWSLLLLTAIHIWLPSHISEIFQYIPLPVVEYLTHKYLLITTYMKSIKPYSYAIFCIKQCTVVRNINLWAKHCSGMQNSFPKYSVLKLWNQHLMLLNVFQ
jgi:hypothetical protein